MKFKVSAPGKAILHGEHACVYGKLAVAASLNLRTTLTLVSHEEKVKLNLKSLGISKEFDKSILDSYILAEIKTFADGSITPVNQSIIHQIIMAFDLYTTLDYKSDSDLHAVVAFVYLWIYISKCYNNGSYISCIVDVESELEIGSGMGSSASYSVCLSTALLVLCGRITPRLLPEDKQVINQWAFQAESIFHGKPSGLDNSVCLYGGAMLFSNGSVTEKLQNLRNVHVLVVNTKIHRETKLLVQFVKKRKELFPIVIDSIMDAIAKISSDCWDLLTNIHSSPTAENEHGDHDDSESLEKLEDLMEINHHLLNALDAGHPKLDQIYNIAKRHSCTAKMTGAGGGGCAIILLTPRIAQTTIDALKEELELCNFDVYDLFLGGPGVQVEFHTL